MYTATENMTIPHSNNNERAASGAFEKHHFTDNAPDHIDRNYWHGARNRIVFRKIQTLKTCDEKILEIGAGRGCVVRYLLKKKKDVFGVDLGTCKPIADAVAPYLRYGIDAKQLPQEMKNSVTTILLLDVLEHLEDPREFLRSLHEEFPNCSHILLTVPAGSDLWSNYDEHYGHALRYETSSLLSQTKQSGYAVCSHGYFFHLLRPALKLTLRFKKKRRVIMKSPFLISLPFHRVMGLLFDLEERVLPGKWAGTSMWAILQRI